MRSSLLMRVLMIVGGVATGTTCLILLVQAGSLARTLERAAVERAERAASAVNLLVEDHLQSVFSRYQAISGTPQFRATLEIDDRATLEHYAGALLKRHDASYVAFVDEAGETVAAAGDTELAALDTGSAGSWLVAHGEEPFSLVGVALVTGNRQIGRLVAVQPVTPENIARWSELCGSQVVFERQFESDEDRISTRVLQLGSLEMRVVSSLDDERAAVLGSMKSLLLAGGIALIVALPISIFLARRVVHPILELKRAAERIGAGDFQVTLETSGSDELAETGRAFEAMAGQLRDTVGRIADGADRVEQTAKAIAVVTDGLLRVTADQVDGFSEVATTTNRIKAQVSGISKSTTTLEEAVEYSSASFEQLRGHGHELGEAADCLERQTREIAKSIEEMTSSAQRVGDALTELAPAADSISSSVVELEVSSREVTVNALETARLSHTVVETAENGRSRVTETIRDMQAIRQATDEAQGVIHDLGKSLAEIGGLRIINKVTGEITLLALNASIIAAESGVQGRAFGIVADEMKNLADRVHASTKEIEERIATAQDVALLAVDAIEAGAQRVEEGVERASQAGASLDQITSTARESEDRMKQVVAFSEEQNATAARVVSQMQPIRDSIEQIDVARERQDSCSGAVHTCSVQLIEVASIARETISEQGRRAARIGESTMAVEASFNAISVALDEQSAACMQATSFIERASEHTNANEEAARRLQAAMRELLQQAEQMREDVRRFQA